MASLGYVTNPLVRPGSEKDPAALERSWNDVAVRIVLVAEEMPILKAGTCLLSKGDMIHGEGGRERVLLGYLQDAPVVAVLLTKEEGEVYRSAPAFTVEDLRTIALEGLVPSDELGIIAMAKALLDWHRRHRFCAACGSGTDAAQAGFRRDCARCGSQHFPRTDPVVIMLVSDGDRCLLGRNARFPQATYSCLAGFLEPGETIEDAVRRETFEEAGIRVGEVGYLASQPWPFPSSIMIGCFGQATSFDITIDREELEDARWFTREEIRLMFAGEHPEGLKPPNPVAIAHHLLREWVEETVSISSAAR